jgi:hypothetical protein
MLLPPCLCFVSILLSFITHDFFIQFFLWVYLVYKYYDMHLYLDLHISHTLIYKNNCFFNKKKHNIY